MELEQGKISEWFDKLTIFRELANWLIEIATSAEGG
jgi:hypothetical protein